MSGSTSSQVAPFFWAIEMRTASAQNTFSGVGCSSSTGAKTPVTCPVSLPIADERGCSGLRFCACASAIRIGELPRRRMSNGRSRVSAVAIPSSTKPLSGSASPLVKSEGRSTPSIFAACPLKAFAIVSGSPQHRMLGALVTSILLSASDWMVRNDSQSISSRGRTKSARLGRTATGSAFRRSNGGAVPGEGTATLTAAGSDLRTLASRSDGREDRFRHMRSISASKVSTST